MVWRGAAGYLPRMPDPATFALFAAASFVLVIIPGPAVIYIVTRSVDQGRSAGVVSMLGVETGGLVHVLAATIGISALVASSAAAFGVLKWAGAAYLVYLGVRRIVRPDEGGDERAPTSPRRMFAQGMVVQGLNPKVAIFFLAFLPQFADPDAGPIAPQILVLGIVFTLIAGLCDGTWALVAGTVGPRLKRSARGSRRLARVSGGIYVGLGLVTAFAGRAKA
jgi:threonine/homoserine/homoserine lactone efflux protein